MSVGGLDFEPFAEATEFGDAGYQLPHPGTSRSAHSALGDRERILFIGAGGLHRLAEELAFGAEGVINGLD